MPWLVCLIFAIGVIGFVGWFGAAIPVQTCDGEQPPGGALLAYQLARTPADIERVFGSATDPCRPGMVAALDRVNRVDLIGFIATYGLFLICFFRALRRSGAGMAAQIGLLAALAAVLFDVLETASQLRITGQLPGSGTMLMLLAIGSTGKYLALAVVALCAGLALLRRRMLFARIAGTACLAGGLMVTVGITSTSARGALSAGNAMAWITMLIYAVVGAIRG